MFKNIKTTLEQPTLYAKSKAEFWSDKHISKQMLKAHLAPNFDGASRKIDFIEKSVNWINEIVPAKEYPLLLDIGCGPGIYAEKFTNIGYKVTGVDFSNRSIDYAKRSALKQDLDINYVFQNYLLLDLQKNFDFATMIYCDYGALSVADRKTIMQKIYKHLKPGGKFLFDVFSMAKYDSFQEKQTWEICGGGGFWHEKEYIAFNGYYKYLDHVTLEQITVVCCEKTTVYYLWTTYFTKDSLIKEALNEGFKVCQVFADVTGKVYSENDFTIAILLEK